MFAHSVIILSFFFSVIGQFSKNSVVFFVLQNLCTKTVFFSNIPVLSLVIKNLFLSLLFKNYQIGFNGIFAKRRASSA